MAQHETAAAKLQDCRFRAQFIAEGRRHDEARFYVNDRHAQDAVRTEEILNRHASREKERGGAIVKPRKVARIENNSGGVAVTPLDEQAFVADEHSQGN